MTQVDQVTLRNASSAEQLSSTAEEMAAQAESLQQLINFFKIAAVENHLQPQLASTVSFQSPDRGKQRSNIRHAQLANAGGNETVTTKLHDGADDNFQERQ